MPNSARVMALVVHPYIMGAPHRLKYFRRVLDTISQKSGVKFWTGAQIGKRRDGRAPNFRQGTRRHCRRHAGAADAGRTLFALGRHLADDENRACRHSAAQQAHADGCSRSALLTGHLPCDPHEAARSGQCLGSCRRYCLSEYRRVQPVDRLRAGNGRHIAGHHSDLHDADLGGVVGLDRAARKAEMRASLLP